MSKMDRLVSSPGTLGRPLVESLEAFSGIGFKKMEVFTYATTPSAPDLDGDPEPYRAKGEEYGVHFASFHLPAVEEDMDATLDKAVRATHFAKAIGAGIVLFKATTRRVLIQAAKPYLDAIGGLGITPVVQNHRGTPIETLEHYREVIDGINDSRMKTLLEVGMFHMFGVHWQDGCDLLGESIALVHLKDMIGQQSVPYGTGEVELPALFRHLESMGYDGDFVVEMQVKDRENTLKYTEEAVKYLLECCL